MSGAKARSGTGILSGDKSAFFTADCKNPAKAGFLFALALPAAPAAAETLFADCLTLHTQAFKCL
jgi:hypothetical protein